MWRRYVRCIHNNVCASRLWMSMANNSIERIGRHRDVLFSIVPYGLSIRRECIIEVLFPKVWPESISKIIFGICRLVEEISRMAYTSSRTDDEVWWWESSCVEETEKSCFVQWLRIYARCEACPDSSHDFILSPICECENECERVSCDRSSVSAIEKGAYIFGKEFEVPDDFKTDRLSDELLDEFGEFLPDKSIESLDLQRRSFEKILFRECPHAYVAERTPFTEREHHLERLSSLFMSEEWGSASCLRPTSISIHDECDMLHGYVLWFWKYWDSHCILRRLKYK